MMLDEAELKDLHQQVAALLRLAVPALVPLDLDDTDACTLWRACELCSFLDHRVENPAALLDPRAMTEADIDIWSERLLLPDERITDPRKFDWYQSYWLVADGIRLGTLALQVWDWGWAGPHLGFASLYVFPECRQQGHAKRVLKALFAAVEQVGLSALRLETDWLWPSAVRLYLKGGFAVVNWKHALSLVRWREQPAPQVRVRQAGMDLLSEHDQKPLITATRNGKQLCWQDHRSEAERKDETQWLRWEPTLALWLALHGWPLIRSEQTWADRMRWMDAGMPEGLAHKIQHWEAYARHHGLPVRTQRIPGLSYPDWEALV
ncbi:MAG: GNAT family N-acetyltransferase [Lamprobacter sp.]|uniref:GNAT family N-acetyltransferase n=1 Tax=Lamprobacter sp. TaxID=3100796 RepID=UPI002B25C6A6|nr:GNAT family N-acetyltransferase [Lamprobacter sp.]MEA3643116.1 GNAT family N-acetyltransferase [Lamprobacter sp.]